MVESSNKISKADVSKLIRSRAHYHMAMRKHGYMMPKLNSRICTMKFVIKAKKGYFFIPMRSDARNVPECFSWPSKEFLIAKLSKFLLGCNAETEEEIANLVMYKRTVALMKKREPDTEWLLVLVGMFLPNDEIFNKSYKWQRPK